MRNSNKSNQILQLAMTHFEEAASWQAVWQLAQPPDGLNRMILSRGPQKINLDFDVRSTVQESQLAQLTKKREQHQHFLVIAGRISQSIKDQLKEQHINYIDSGGNAYIETAATFILIEGKKSGYSQKRKHLFTNASIQLLFHLFLKPDLLKMTYRQIASETGASLDNISKTLRTLRDNKYVKPLESGGYIFVNKKNLLERWIPEFGERLKPSLLIGRYSFLPDVNWKFLQIDTSQTRWGGEPAAEKIFGNIIQPSTFTIYSNESHQDLVRNYRLIPDPEGNIYAYQTFWDMSSRTNEESIPELLVYADLILSKKEHNTALAHRLIEIRADKIL